MRKRVLAIVTGTAVLALAGVAPLEHRDGRLVFNVDVGSSDVKVDAATGGVLAVDHDD